MFLKTLNLNEAAIFLQMSPQALRQKAAQGKIPGAKPGKKWCFHADDLAEYLRSLYDAYAKASSGDNLRSKKCHSIKETMSGGLTSHTMVQEYGNLLGLPIK